MVRHVLYNGPEPDLTRVQFSLKETSSKLGYSVKILRQLIGRGKLDCVQVSKWSTIYVTQQAIDKFIAENTISFGKENRQAPPKRRASKKVARDGESYSAKHGLIIKRLIVSRSGPVYPGTQCA